MNDENIVATYRGCHIYVENDMVKIDQYEGYEFPTVSEAYQFIEDHDR